MRRVPLRYLHFAAAAIPSGVLAWMNYVCISGVLECGRRSRNTNTTAFVLGFALQTYSRKVAHICRPHPLPIFAAQRLRIVVYIIHVIQVIDTHRLYDA